MVKIASKSSHFKSLLPFIYRTATGDSAVIKVKMSGQQNYDESPVATLLSRLDIFDACAVQLSRLKNLRETQRGLKRG